MIWFTWRRFRIQAAITVGVLAGFGILLVVTGRSIADAYTAANLDSCGNDCASAITHFLRQARSGTSGSVYDLALALMYGIPALIGVFWGAPLIARELEAGTHQLAWSQSVTRTRWLATRLAVIGTASVAAVGVLSWAVTAWAHQIDQRAGDRITPLVFGARGTVPIGYALFGFVLGVTVGMIIRRTVPAMATTLAIYVAAVASVATWIRAHLVPPVHTTAALDMERLDTFIVRSDGSMTVIGEGPGDVWVLSNQTITSTGGVFTGSGRPPSCDGGPDSPEGDPRACRVWVEALGLRQDLTYHPSDHFWSLQWIETGVFIALAVLLTGFGFWWLRRRLA